MGKTRLLIFSVLPPVPIDRGDKNRLFHILRLLREVADVRLVCLQRDWERRVNDWSGLEGIRIDAVTVRKTEIVRRGIQAMLSLQPYIAFRFGLKRIIDLILGHIADWHPQAFLGGGIPSLPVLQKIYGVRRILDLVDSPSLYSRMVQNSTGMDLYSRLNGLIQLRIKHYEGLAISLSDQVLINSRRDKEYLCRVHGQEQKIHVLENCVPAQLLEKSWRPDPARLPTVLFVGNMIYGPNRSGVRHFVQKIFPLIRTGVPQTQFVVCGQGSSELVQGLGEPAGVRAIGFVNDLISVYLSASVVVVPVPVAGGVQYKLLEAMALGVPIVASGQTAEVADLKNGQELLVGDTDENYASMVISILEDSNLAKQLSEQGRIFVSAHHVWEDKKDLLRQVVNG